MAQMRKLRGPEKDIEDGSDTGEEWDEARTEREKRRQEKREERWKARDEKKKAREARCAELGEDAELSEDSDSEKDDQKADEKEKRLEAMPAGMQEEERLESDPEASEDSEMEKPQESYFELVKRYTTKKTLPEVNHSTIDYKPFTKNLYVQVKEITAMKDHEVDNFRRTNGDIRVRGKNCPRPIKTFLQCGLPERVLKILEKRDCVNPFPIQMQAIPALMCGRDIIGVAQTGSGKTLAYLLPMIRHIQDQPPLTFEEGP